MRTHRTSSIQLVACVALAATLIRCDISGEMNPAAATSHAANYADTGGRTHVNLDVGQDAFTAVNFTPAQPAAPAAASAPRPLKNASTSAGAESAAAWVVFTGEVAREGSTVTLTIAGVERDGRKLEGAELAEYARCAITATAGDRFGDQVMAAIQNCLGTSDVVEVRMFERRPSDLLVGTWFARIRSGGDCRDDFADVTLTFSSTQLEVQVVYDFSSSSPCAEHFRDERLRLEVVIDDAKIRILPWERTPVEQILYYVIDPDGSGVAFTQTFASGSSTVYFAPVSP